MSAEIDGYRPDDRVAVEAMYRRVFGEDAAALNRVRWEWLHRLNPAIPSGTSPRIWIAREHGTVVGQFAAMPVTLHAAGRDIDATWGIDFMIAPDGQRKGLGRTMVDAWEHGTGATLVLRPTEQSHRLFLKLQWPDVGPIPRLAKPLSTRARHESGWRESLQRTYREITTRPTPSDAVTEVTAFDDRFTRLWDRVAPRLGFAVRRDAAYLTWKYRQIPGLQYSIAILPRGDEIDGYAIYRHVQQQRWRVTLLVDFLADPSAPAALLPLAAWVEHEALRVQADTIRAYCRHRGFHDALRRAGFVSRTSKINAFVKIQAFETPPAYYHAVDDWHITLGDSDIDR